MIDFKLEFKYDDEENPTLKNAEGNIPKGKCIVLCGDSGCGKTTIIRCLNHLVPDFYEGELKGLCHLNGKDIEELSVGETGEIASTVFQEPRSHFFTINSSTEVAFAAENFGIPHNEICKRVDNAFAIFHLERLKNRNVYELSSGERQLISILSAWASDTDILLLDEPTANLDFSAIEQLSEILSTLKSQGKTMVLSEHRLHYLKDIADEFWLVSDGEIKQKFTRNEILKLNEDGLSELSLRAIDLSEITLSEERNTDIPENTNTLTAENIEFRYKSGKEPILNKLSLNAHTGEVIGLIGSNGCGKTTFGKIISGLINPDKGNILYNGNPVKRKALQQKALFIMQETEFQFFTNSVRKELLYGLKNSAQIEEKIDNLLKSCNMWECRDRHPFSLSGGQMQRLALMIATLSEKPIVVLDEPTAGLDKKSLNACIKLIHQMQKTKIVLIITHDAELIAKACTRTICISGGIAEKEFPLDNNDNLHELLKHMHESFQLKEDKNITPPQLSVGKVDSRIKLLILLAGMIATISPQYNTVACMLILMIILTLVEGYFKSAIAGILSLILLWTGREIWTSNIFAFFIPRMILPWLCLETIISKNEASRTLAAFRKLHFPEIIVMITSVIFRFFPVLINDMKILNQSIATRGTFATMSQKMKALPEYLEVLIVPMALRVIKIAETLSASAETRGIALRRRKSSYIALKFTFWDAIFSILLIVSIISGFIIKL